MAGVDLARQGGERLSDEELAKLAVMDAKGILGN